MKGKETGKYVFAGVGEGGRGREKERMEGVGLRTKISTGRKKVAHTTLTLDE